MYVIIRFIHIITIFAATGVLFSKKTRGEHIAKALKKLGPSFIKFGQTMSVRPDIVGEEIAASLEHLQDSLPPFSFKKAQHIIEKDLGKPVSELFLEFDETPVAAASIAQVHKATTKEGDIVAVKILRPKIQKEFNRDLKLFYSIARFLERFKKIKRLRPVAVVDVFADTIRKELDLRLEAASASELAENCKNDSWICIPKVYWQLTSQKVMVTDWVDGIPINNLQALKSAGHNLEKIIENLSLTFLTQSFRDGFFHADLHPGNIFIDKNGKIAPVDFGIMGRLDKQTRIYVAEIIRGFLTGDYEHVAKIHFYAGYVPKHKSMADFTLACRAIGEPIIGLPANQVSIAKLLALLFKITEDFEMQTQPQLLLLQKTMVLVEGVGQQLYPEANMWQQTDGWIKKWAKENLGLEAKVKDGLQDLMEILRKLPDNLKKIDRLLDKLAG